jgi:hypothetical protein
MLSNRFNEFRIEADFFTQVLPVWIVKVDEFIFPLTFPLFQLLFSFDSVGNVLKFFEVNEFITVVFGCEGRIDLGFVLKPFSARDRWSLRCREHGCWNWS